MDSIILGDCQHGSHGQMTRAAARTRRSRMRRKQTGKRIELSPRDLDIFQALNRYRYLCSNFLFALVGGASETRFKERLTDLYHEAGYIDRPEQQWQFARCRSLPVIYELTDAGAGVLREQRGIAQDSPLFGQDHGGGSRQFAHAVMIADIMSSVEFGVRQDPSLRLISWREILAKAPEQTHRMQRPFEIPVSISYSFPRTGKIEQAATTILPDALFGLEYRGASAPTYRFFALEADRGTMPVFRGNLTQSSYLKKVLAYREIGAQKLYQSHLGLPNLLVLTVTTSSRHQNTIMEVVQELEGGSKIFLFKTLSSLGGIQLALSSAPQMLTEPWLRVGFGKFTIGNHQ